MVSDVATVRLSEIRTSNEPIKDWIPSSDEDLDDSFSRNRCYVRAEIRSEGKCLQKLNDEPMEATCTDISVLLMIMAGPGSRKDFIGYVQTFILLIRVSSRPTTWR
ncbi:hypothetical protein DsansV1_C32g0221021 [Dioscorea sansibarensis]